MGNFIEKSDIVKVSKFSFKSINDLGELLKLIVERIHIVNKHQNHLILTQYVLSSRKIQELKKDGFQLVKMYKNKGLYRKHFALTMDFFFKITEILIDDLKSEK